MNNRMKLYLLEALLYLGWARILKARQFAKVAPTLGIEREETSHEHHETTERTLGYVSRSVRTMAKHTPWESKCMVMAMAAMKMLERRGIESTLYLGTAKDHTGKMIAHAWLRSGPYYITGYEEMNKFITVNTFANKLSVRGEASKMRQTS
ncbi:lasso peptide biosynthesis B2 protein [Paenibacillus phyllosphaerae]|nr:lasso peptide biosynthesis B2 protein [Paenibacillus phyllosphaerae]